MRPFHPHVSVGAHHTNASTPQTLSDIHTSNVHETREQIGAIEGSNTRDDSDAATPHLSYTNSISTQITEDGGLDMKTRARGVGWWGASSCGGPPARRSAHKQGEGEEGVVTDCTRGAERWG